MNLAEALDPLRAAAFRAWRTTAAAIPGGRIEAFGQDGNRIEAIFVINLDRQPKRWRRVTRELRRFTTADGDNLMSIVRRVAAIDARDGRAVAATADVDPLYQIGDQLFVQPDERLARSFSADEPVRMSRQEVAVARSHIEAWKAIATGPDSLVLILEDDAWFKPGARASINEIWREVRKRSASGQPDILFFSYEDAGGTASREEERGGLFRPVRGLWHLSGYVLTQAGAMNLLRSMPVKGPVDLWMNYQFAELDALAMTSPAIAQRLDGKSDNAYSVMPYLARAGVVDGGHAIKHAGVLGSERVLAWTRRADHESLAMALSMLGLRVRVFDSDEEPLSPVALLGELRLFDALVDPPLLPAALATAVAANETKFILEGSDLGPATTLRTQVAPSRVAVVDAARVEGRWATLCGFLKIATPVEAFPLGAPRSFRLFRRNQTTHRMAEERVPRKAVPIDNSPWVLPPSARWRPTEPSVRPTDRGDTVIVASSMTSPSESFPRVTETFPGNLASFSPDRLSFSNDGVRIVLDDGAGNGRRLTSGAFASSRSFTHGWFQADVRAAAGPGLITGFFLHRASPRQEIDIEILGTDPTRMLTNVYFNPGEAGTAMEFGYRGAPHWIDLGFDATQDFHEYAIWWTADRIVWLVDGRPVHERASWEPTPIPHLPMRLHANLWAPRSVELAGRINAQALPACATFRNVVVTTKMRASLRPDEPQELIEQRSEVVDSV
ncbi:MAG: glycoside hydrolase [Paracoccus sp.]|nr:glycoside hydrolase [Paracoccus sp. (in: a-proteobacteria)]HAS33104.1 glycoside hydrolase [Microbacterium sp.]HBR89490.1 glycoside hydrolase [Microbacterium sp.]|tara:strand:- start:1621 stop:3801 length:2181 start_codon:yes stop_codon:yes gene_type:complete